VALLASLVLAGCLENGAPVVVAQAPPTANGLSVLLAVPKGVLGSGDGQATFRISYNGATVYPPGGVLPASIPIHESKGSVFVPYQAFVVDNGDYLVDVELEGHTTRATVPIHKWVYYVYVLPYKRDSSLFADVVLEQTRGQPNDRIFAQGELRVEVHYRGQHGEEDQLRVTRTLLTEGDQSFQRIEFPFTSFDPKDGYYSLEATFSNLQASGNNNVGLDPELANARPPTNWVHLPS